MELFVKNRILELPSHAVEEIKKCYNLDKPGRLDEAVDILEKWIRKQDHILKKDFTREYLARTITSCKGSVEKAKKQIDSICTKKTLLPHFFTVSNIKNELKDILHAVIADDIEETPHTKRSQSHSEASFFIPRISSVNYYWRSIVVLPKVTEDFYRVMLIKINIFLDKYLMFYQYIITLGEYIKAHDYCNGFMVVYDFEGIDVFNLVTRINPVELQQFMSILITGFGVRYKGIYLLTQSTAVDLFIKMMKQFVSPKIGDRCYVIKTVEDLHTAVPKDILPIEYGGKERSLNDLVEDWIEELSSEDHVEYMKMMSKAYTDENLRISDQFNDEYMGTPGSFRNMTVD